MLVIQNKQQISINYQAKLAETLDKTFSRERKVARNKKSEA
jgi:hypothetical protein